MLKFPVTGSGKDFVLDRASLEKIGSSPPKLISLTEARTRLKENSRICQLEKVSSPGNYHFFSLSQFMLCQSFSVLSNRVHT